MGAPPEVAALLEEIGQPERRGGGATATGEIGLDPELDEFMVGTTSSRQLTPLILAR